MKKKIDFRQLKYTLPVVIYLALLLLGYLVIDTFNIELGGKVDKSLVTKNEFNADLPVAQVNEDIGDKMSNMVRQYGYIKDLTAVGNVENDRDSLLKLQEYSSKYTEEESRIIREKMRADSLEALLRNRDSHAVESSSDKDQSAGEFTRALSPSDRKKVEGLRRKGINVEQLEHDLGITFEGERLDRLMSSVGGADTTGLDAVADTMKAVVSHNRSVTRKMIEQPDEDDDDAPVVKRITETSAHFNTISANEPEGNVIKAIIDEEIKVVDGSRVRLRLLDDVEIDHIRLRKGSYLYAQMSGFSKQRIKGKISTIMSGDNILKCNLSLYDMDGLEGLYVPQSAFRETAKDVGSGALSGSMNMSSSLDARTNVAQFASQALQNAYQRTSQAISKAIKKNRVRLKYGTQVYLINGNKKKNETGVSSPSVPEGKRMRRSDVSMAGLR